MSDKNLASMIAEACAAVGGKLSADKRNAEQKYDYISADKILSVCGQALAQAGIAIIPAIVDQAVNQVSYTNQYNKTIIRNDAEVDFIFTLLGGGEKYEVTWVGRGTDYSSPDKALYKAITSGHRYFLAKLLMVGEGNEDGEHDTADIAMPAAMPAPSIKPVPVSTPAGGAMSLADAENTLNSEGVRYGDIATEKLVYMANAMSKLQGTAKEKPEHAAKIAAIQTILSARSSSAQDGE